MALLCPALVWWWYHDRLFIWRYCMLLYLIQNKIWQRRTTEKWAPANPKDTWWNKWIGILVCFGYELEDEGEIAIVIYHIHIHRYTLIGIIMMTHNAIEKAKYYVAVLGLFWGLNIQGFHHISNLNASLFFLFGSNAKRGVRVIGQRLLRISIRKCLCFTTSDISVLFKEKFIHAKIPEQKRVSIEIYLAIECRMDFLNCVIYHKIIKSWIL